MDDWKIRELIAARSMAINAHDVEAAIADIDQDVAIYELVPPLAMEGIAASRQRTVDWFATYSDGPYWQDGEITVISDGDVAFSHAINRVTGTSSSGDQVDMWFRTTPGWRRRDGRWRIVHDHNSVPFDPASGKGRLDLEP
ncbi:YybH family protein [Sphingomonas mollis]|uniref:Nuclear transport factor 2 family protein n=1 Tax=Sphingomonas mollis TaxID=2795726 RepID=A0ABS0XUE2_9SPHN|nr:nuclear transport factor 2 family protein [Sphingomonas sp. BT553]